MIIRFLIAIAIGVPAVMIGLKGIEYLERSCHAIWSEAFCGGAVLLLRAVFVFLICLMTLHIASKGRKINDEQSTDG